MAQKYETPQGPPPGYIASPPPAMHYDDPRGMEMGGYGSPAPPGHPYGPPPGGPTHPHPDPMARPYGPGPYGPPMQPPGPYDQPPRASRCTTSSRLPGARMEVRRRLVDITMIGVDEVARGRGSAPAF
ncbi:hypothetical protein BTJ68_00313 [Hortaea werneckii EXF-2000]|uniref:Uncharacterized protein n=1 Tax=Hortaea werneckii EXF-2000 TaxID=1157616 RepID=A0A1Z5TUP9_HORWE|nr:hypothetical protein BTJ68_00313 [Hortaea werneckii EXF-2000]